MEKYIAKIVELLNRAKNDKSTKYELSAVYNKHHDTCFVDYYELKCLVGVYTVIFRINKNIECLINSENGKLKMVFTICEKHGNKNERLRIGINDLINLAKS